MELRHGRTSGPSWYLVPQQRLHQGDFVLGALFSGELRGWMGQKFPSWRAMSRLGRGMQFCKPPFVSADRSHSGVRRSAQSLSCSQQVSIIFCEKVFINSFELDRPASAHSHAMFDH
jgi:hypothetical protein